METFFRFHDETCNSPELKLWDDDDLKQREDIHVHDTPDQATHPSETLSKYPENPDEIVLVD